MSCSAALPRARTCDGVDWQRDKVKVLGSCAELAMARRHYKHFTEVDPPTMLPYMWMGLRHAGLALLNNTAQTEGKEPTPEQLRSMVDAYSSCKVSALFAVFDARSDNDDIIAVGCNDDEVTEAAAAAISTDDTAAGAASVTISSDVIFVAVPRILQNLAPVQQKPQSKPSKSSWSMARWPHRAASSPRGVMKHPDIFKWHRKWMQVMHLGSCGGRGYSKLGGYQSPPVGIKLSEGRTGWSFLGDPTG